MLRYCTVAEGKQNLLILKNTSNYIQGVYKFQAILVSIHLLKDLQCSQLLSQACNFIQKILLRPDAYLNVHF